MSGIEVGGGLKQLAAAFAEFEGASSGLLGDDDLQEAAAALEPGTSAAVIAGTATAVSNRVSRRPAERWQQQGSYPYDQPEPAQPQARGRSPRASTLPRPGF